jgi:bifunctional ADP-heptose synthase (sugar kinase/adenylyltransferase)
LQLIQQIQPDVLVKGADYDPNETDPASKKYIVGREAVISNGGKVIAIDLVPGFSTTAILEKVRK